MQFSEKMLRIVNEIQKEASRIQMNVSLLKEEDTKYNISVMRHLLLLLEEEGGLEE